MSEIPWERIETIFFDAGNTLVSIDFDWVSEELGARGVACEPEALRRAEAAARPRVSAGLAAHASKETLDAFRFYLGTVLAALEPARRLGEARLEALTAELAPVLRAPGQTQRLWSWVIPGVPEALASLKAAGLQLAVVSNSDGSVEQSLVDQGLREPFEHVFDSFRVGHEKPDPRLFEHALEVCSADPGRTVHVGDLYVADVAGARAAGIHALLLDPWDDWGEVDCATIQDLTALCARLLAARGGA